jgi:hypothetical protein
MLYDLDGEDWLPEYEAKRNYHVNVQQLTHAVNEGELRWRKYTNPHNDREFKLYCVADLEGLFGKNERRTIAIRDLLKR